MLVKRIAEFPHIDQQLVDKTNHSLPFHEVTQYFGLKYTQGLHGEKKKKRYDSHFSETPAVFISK